MTDACETTTRQQLLGHVLEASQLGLEALELLRPALEVATRLGTQAEVEEGAQAAGLCRLARWALDEYHNALDVIREEAARSLRAACATLDASVTARGGGRRLCYGAACFFEQVLSCNALSREIVGLGLVRASACRAGFVPSPGFHWHDLAAALSVAGLCLRRCGFLVQRMVLS